MLPLEAISKNEIGANDIVLHQEMYRANWFQCKAYPPKWKHAYPTPLLIQKGLTSYKIQQIV